MVSVTTANSDLENDSHLHSFVNESAKPPSNGHREKTEIDLVLSPTLAFYERSNNVVRDPHISVSLD